jgi:hypothetical protein
MFKRKHYIIAYVFFIFTNCKDDIKTSFSEINVTTPKNTIVEVSIPNAHGNIEIASNINSVIQKTVITALHIGEPDNITSKSIEESITAFNDEYNAFKTDFSETEQPWEAQIDADIMYQSSEIISIAITSYVNTGGAHGLLNIAILNFDTETGNLIEHSALFSNTEGFKAVAQKHFKAATKDKDLFLEHDGFELPANMGYSDGGIVLLYNTYEIAPYSTGIIQFTIPFEEVNPYLVFNSL